MILLCLKLVISKNVYFLFYLLCSNFKLKVCTGLNKMKFSTISCQKVLPAMRQEFAGSMTRPVATGDWTSVARNANTTITITIQSIHTESEHETSGNRRLLVSVFAFAFSKRTEFKGYGWERDGFTLFSIPQDLGTCNAVRKIST